MSSPTTPAAEGAILRPQPGPQERFLTTPADIAIYGGAAGGGKSWSLLFEPLRHVDNPRFGGVIFRRTAPEITAEGGLWSKSIEMYGLLGASPASSRHLWKFKSGAAVSFGHIQYETDLLKWHSSEIPFIGFDELPTFTERQFVYLLTRNRSTCGVKPYVRATCNPDADSWVVKWVRWWIDEATGYPIPERSGVLRWFVRDGDAIVWGDTRADLRRQYPDSSPKSFTFVPAKLSDNRILERKDPGYRANLEAQPTVDRERLLGHPVHGGNWKIRIGGKYFDRMKARIIPAVPVGTVAMRYWDTAAQKGITTANTAGVLLGKTPAGRFVVIDCAAGNCSPAERKAMMHQTASLDARLRPDKGVTLVVTWIERPGGFGTESVDDDILHLAGFYVLPNKVTSSSGSKVERWKPLSSQWEAGNVDVVDGPWNEAFLAELDAAPAGPRVDRIDAAAGAFNKLQPAPGDMEVEVIDPPRRDPSVPVSRMGLFGLS